ncbi:glycosyltransferase family 2 protein [Carboxylicivirga linearis]|uniref:Glycosyltransferase family 2 protein n=1 Tax=Carboxylicivirga linearis TaxID=1628157 RepID=A0ABS5JTP9_9BACT|nr:glycosyltransferase family 2 protein [Carboxylicivirga linearis]MBS2098232.1 glycosyltransferase family 2 protein [Carboxylicivirga linearis]
MVQEPFFSVVIPLYNKERDIEHTIQSVLKQEFTSFELIIVNDGSTDSGLEVVNSIVDDRLFCYTIKNSGPSIARNFGVEKAKSEYIVFLDADDIWYPQHLKKLKQLINNKYEVSWYCTGYEYMLEGKSTYPMNVSLMLDSKNSYGVCDYFENSLSDSLVSTSSVCLKKEFFMMLGGFNPKYDTGQDTDLWIRAGLVSQLAYINRITVVVNLQGSNRITDMPILSKRHLQFDDHLNVEEDRLPFRKFMNFYRYNHYLKFKMAGFEENAQVYLVNLDAQMLNRKQRFLLKIPGRILRAIYDFKSKLYKYGIRLRASN